MTWHYAPPLREFRFVLEELLGIQRQWADIPAFADLGVEATGQILEAAGHFVVEKLATLNAAGDADGCRYRDGTVATPAGFAQAYRDYCDGGWPALACDARYGGQGLPHLLNAVLYEMLYSANHAWTMYPGIVHGAYQCMRAHASPVLIEHYLAKIVSGEWLCTMCLTEAQAGSDVGLITSRAEPAMDGAYRISGSKIFISGGEHDLTANIIHLVLARLPDAPAGTKGISLFLVPKYLGPLDSERNAVYCDGIERKMGLKGSATCSLRFDGARGWLIGEPHRGLAAMFVMMNSARLGVALQGLGHAEMAYQNAVRYAHERRQMRGIRQRGAERLAAGAADPIVEQPAIRKVLMTLRAFVEGQRAVGSWTAHLLDVAESHPDERRRVVRKIIGDQGRRIGLLFRVADEAALSCHDSPTCRDYGDALSAVILRWRTVTQALIDEARVDPCAAYGVASDYLRLAGLCLLGVWWARIARTAAARVHEPFYRSKWDTARFFFDHVLPEASLRLELIDKRHVPLPSIEMRA